MTAAAAPNRATRLVNELPALVRPGTPVLVGRAVGDGQPLAFRPLVEALLTGRRAPGVVDLAALGPFRPVLVSAVPGGSHDVRGRVRRRGSPRADVDLVAVLNSDVQPAGLDVAVVSSRAGVSSDDRPV